MSTIITATDFSDIANNAVRYACDLALAQNKRVVILNTYQVPIAFNETPVQIASMEESKNIAQEELDKLNEELFKEYPQLGISSALAHGDITDVLKEYIEKEGADIVVVGNSSSDNSAFWLGSNLLNTLRNLSCPVVAVPKNYKYKKVDNIVFACDFKHVADTVPGKDVVSLTQQTGGQLHVLNVDHENEHFDAESPHEYAMLDEKLKDANPVYHHIDAEDVEEGINNFIAANHVDWLVVLPHKHSFFESLFHKSQTKALVNNATIPVVSLHEHK